MHNLVSMAVHLQWLLLVGQNPPSPLPPPHGKEDILKAMGIRVKSCAKAVAFDYPYELQIRQWPRPHFGKIRIFSWAEL